MITKLEREAKAKKKAQKKGGMILGFGLVFIFLSFYSYQILFADNILLDKPDKELFIHTGSTFSDVVQKLEKDTVIHDRLSFMFLSKLLGYRENVKAGRYVLRRNMNNFQLFRKLRGGHQDPVKFIIVNFRTKEELISRFAKKLEIDSNQLSQDFNNNNFLKKYGVNDTTVMALFLPNSYEIFWNATSSELLDVFEREYKKFWNHERLDRAQAVALLPVEVIIMASIVDQETQKNDEKSKIAGVYMNRLNNGLRLQADPTLIFATKDFKAKRVNEFHRYFQSPYNTYRRKGLPPGPINTPSITSIDAVLNYEKHDFYFFCANPNLSGYHLFSHNFEEHLGVAKNYWKSLDKENIH